MDRTPASAVSTVPINARLQGVFDHVSAQRGADALSDAIVDLILTILNILRSFLETCASPSAPAPNCPALNATIRPQPEATPPRRATSASPHPARRHQRPPAANPPAPNPPICATAQPTPTEPIPNPVTTAVAISPSRQARPPDPHPRRQTARPEHRFKHA
ncbi:hypothetical protein AruPA_11065 [Acidiphilium sp. PA]|uniref:hypothetical protein n=1 Tax=Acidiphilium sp. PA TaxID=2871705 RepID=UPI0022439A17|nr:hypothetical protein [Acidiphilium sp. PA]MCW8307579.1 hypothetical protein [Acidiphilium sp. PA]